MIDLLTNYYFLSFIVAWILSILIKTGLNAYRNKKNPDIKDGFKNGGMPSSHSTVVSAITFSIFLTNGLSPTFFVSLVFSMIIISDAFRLRRNVGLQAEQLNILLKKSKQKTINVVHGHTLPQVIAGILLGVLTSYLVFIILF
jgi:acid phosphatase family membrane protein YuiD